MKEKLFPNRKIALSEIFEAALRSCYTSIMLPSEVFFDRVFNLQSANGRANCQ